MSTVETTMSKITRAVLAPLVIALIAAGCSSDGPAATDDEAATTTLETSVTAEPETTVTTADPAVSEAPPALSGLDGAIGTASDLALSWFNGAPFDEATYETSFDDTFRAQVGFDQMTPLLEQLRLEGPFEVREIQGSTPTEAELIVLGAGGERALLAVAVASSDDPTMIGLFIGPAEAPTFDAPTSVDDAIARLQAMGTLRVGTFDASCATADSASAVAAEEQAPIGSGFKLWVLAAVVDAVDSGSISWDDEVAIRDELDSIPSGITQDDPDGTLLTVRELAERMIEISDNTATDHLMDFVGRDAVEAAMTSSGHSDPSRNLPFMNTREFTIVKFGDAEFFQRYLAADTDQRRQMLNNEVPSMPLPPLSNIVSVTDPVEVESIEWFASPLDLSAAH